MNQKTNNLILTGAGFSLPFLKHKDYKLSTWFITELMLDENLIQEFCQELYEIDTPDYFKKICEASKLIRDHVGDRFNLNFEHIFYMLENIVNLSDNQKGINNSFLLETIFEPKSQFKNLGISFIDLYLYKEFILDIISKFEINQEDINLLSKYFSHIIKNQNLLYYTLNYDDLIIKILEHIHKNIENLDLCRDFNLGTQLDFGSIDSKFIFSQFELYQNRHHSVFHLHGSVLYSDSYNTKSIEFSRSINSPEVRKSYLLGYLTGHVRFNPSRNNDGGYKYDKSFITGFNKAIKLTEEPYLGIYAKFREDVSKADELTIFGYSFGDEHINSILSSCPPKLKKITVVDFTSDNENTKENYNVFWNRLISTIRPFGENRKIELWNQKGPSKDKITYSKGSEEEIEFDRNGTQKYIERKIEGFD